MASRSARSFNISSLLACVVDLRPSDRPRVGMEGGRMCDCVLGRRPRRLGSASHCPASVGLAMTHARRSSSRPHHRPVSEPLTNVRRCTTVTPLCAECQSNAERCVVCVAVVLSVGESFSVVQCLTSVSADGRNFVRQTFVAASTNDS